MKRTQSKNSSVQFLALTGLFIALVYVFTVFINIRLPISINGGLIHLGNVPLFICAILFGKKPGMIAGGVGMALFDITSSYTVWAPFTLVIVGLMGYLVGWITEKDDSYPRIVLALFVALIVKLVGYYIAEIILYGNWISPLTSLPGNIIQITVGALVTLVCIGPLKKATKQILNNRW